MRNVYELLAGKLERYILGDEDSSGKMIVIHKKGRKYVMFDFCACSKNCQGQLWDSFPSVCPLGPTQLSFEGFS
jgi:hypothetical protein